MMNMTNKAALPVAIAASMGLSMTAGAATITSFADSKVSAEAFNTNTNTDLELTTYAEDGTEVANVLGYNVEGFNPSSLTFSTTNANLRTADDSYVLIAYDGTKPVGIITNESEEVVIGDAVNGDLIFETGVGGMKVAQAVSDGENDPSNSIELRDLDSSFNLRIVDTTDFDSGDDSLGVDVDFDDDAGPDKGDISALEINQTDELRLQVSSDLGLNGTVALTVDESGQDVSSARTILAIASRYAIQVDSDLDSSEGRIDATIDVNEQRERFTSATSEDEGTQVQGTINVVDLNDSGEALDGRFLEDPSIAPGDRTITVTVSSAAGDQAIEQFQLDGNDLTFDEDNNSWTLSGADHPAQGEDLQILVDVTGDDAIEQRAFSAEAELDAATNRLAYSYLDSTNIGNWDLNGHQAYLPFFPTGNVAAQLRVTNQSGQDDVAVTMDAWNQGGEQLLDNVVVGNVDANSILTLFKSDIVEAIGEDNAGQPLNLRITTNAPQNQVMVSGYMIVPNQGTSELQVYNGAEAGSQRGR